MSDNSTQRPAQRGDWGNKPLTDQHVILTLDRVFTSEEMAKIRQGCIPVEMEDKWFIFYEDDVLYLHRSWTGVCIFVAEFMEVTGGYRISRLRVNRDPKEFNVTDDAEVLKIFSDTLEWRLLQRHPSNS